MEFRYQPDSLPNPSAFLTPILYQLSGVNVPPSTENHERNLTGNPLASLPPETLAKVKPLLLTLHCLFPNEFLLALDILDRRLVRNYISADACPDAENTSHGARFVISSSSKTIQRPPATQVSVGSTRLGGPILSASATQHQQYHPPGDSSTLGLRLPDKYYEIHLDSWNCTCPAFTLASVLSLDDGEVSESEQQHDESTEERLSALTAAPVDAWRFGGRLTTGNADDVGREESSAYHLGPAICRHLLACVLASQCPGLFGHGMEQVMVSEAELAALYAS